MEIQYTTHVWHGQGQQGLLYFWYQFIYHNLSVYNKWTVGQEIYQMKIIIVMLPLSSIPMSQTLK